MELETWHLWIIMAIILFIVEIFTPALLASCLAVGCIAAGLFSYMDMGIKIQLLSFSLATLGTFFGVRPFMLKYAHNKNSNVKTNTDALVGKEGRVVVTIDNSLNQGRVSVGGDDWKAETENQEIIKEGEKIEVLKVNSTILTVKSISKK